MSQYVDTDGGIWETHSDDTHVSLVSVPDFEDNWQIGAPDFTDRSLVEAIAIFDLTEIGGGESR